MYGNLNFKQEWDPALVTVKKLLNRENVSKAEWHDLFAINNRITSWVNNGSQLLLKALEEELAKHVASAAKRIHANQGDNDLLRAYSQEWTNFSVLIEYLPTPFAFIERGVPRAHSGVMRTDGRHGETLFVVRNCMFALWNGHVFETIQTRLLSAAMELVMRERSGEAVESSLVVSTRQAFVNYDHGKDEPLKMYENFFEKQYIDSCREFYTARTAQVLAENGILNYMSYAHEKLTDEDDRAKKYLDFSQPASYNRLLQASVHILVVQFQEQILNEATNLIAENETRRLRMLYSLVNKTETGISPLLDRLHRYIKTEGLDTMKNNAENIVNDCEKYVEQLLAMYIKFTALVTNAFCNDARFLTIRDQAFQEVVNNTDVFSIELANQKNKGKPSTQPAESKCPELLANYCDLLLRKSVLTKKLTSEEIDEKLNNVLLVLKYVSNKDVFMRYHKSHLSRRLILELSADQDKEEGLVNKFREHGMPSDFVSKLYRMLQDVEVNKDLSTEFKRAATTNESSSIADCINLKILNAGAWSRGRDRCHVSFPPELEEVIPEVEEFYKTKHTGRKLNWAHNWSSAVISFVNQKGKYELEVSAFQMAVLFGWNDRPREKISLEGLRLATELPEIDLSRTLLSLVMNPKVKSQVLLTDCNPINPKNFNDSTMFWINQEFAVIKGDKPQSRGRVNLVNRINMNQENIDDEAHEEILRLREFRIQEAIVKIMKMRRVMALIPLNNELIDMLKYMFVPTRRLIKQQIEWLIEQQYIKRDEKDPEKIIYIT